eukprot:676295-Prymnesium_polylepis.1
MKRAAREIAWVASPSVPTPDRLAGRPSTPCSGSATRSPAASRRQRGSSCRCWAVEAFAQSDGLRHSAASRRRCRRARSQGRPGKRREPLRRQHQQSAARTTGSHCPGCRSTFDSPSEVCARGHRPKQMYGCRHGVSREWRWPAFVFYDYARSCTAGGGGGGGAPAFWPLSRAHLPIPYSIRMADGRCCRQRRYR